MPNTYTSSTGKKFDYSSIQAQGLSRNLTRFFKNHAEKARFTTLLRDLPEKVRIVRFIQNYHIQTWQSHLDDRSLLINANPNYRAGQRYCGRTLHHEISHQTYSINALGKKQAREFEKLEPTWFKKIVTSFGGDKNMARLTVEYTFEERQITANDSAFAVEINERPKTIPSVQASLQAFKMANGYA